MISTVLGEGGQALSAGEIAAYRRDGYVIPELRLSAAGERETARTALSRALIPNSHLSALRPSIGLHNIASADLSEGTTLQNA
jgi:hypothetical protein